MLHLLFLKIDALYQEPADGDGLDAGLDAGLDDLPEVSEVLSAFLSAQGFNVALDEIRGNTNSPEAFRKRFWRWFNMFRIMKFLHYARIHGYPDVPVGEAVHSFLSLKKQHSNRELLEMQRKNEY